MGVWDVMRWREDKMGTISFFYHCGEGKTGKYLDAPFYNGSW
jgi:hypothetical protein